MIGLESIWSSHLSFMAKCAFWMLGGLTIYGFISFLVITIMSVMQVFVSLPQIRSPFRPHAPHRGHTRAQAQCRVQT